MTSLWSSVDWLVNHLHLCQVEEMSTSLWLSIYITWRRCGQKKLHLGCGAFLFWSYLGHDGIMVLVSEIYYRFLKIWEKFPESWISTISHRIFTAFLSHEQTFKYFLLLHCTKLSFIDMKNHTIKLRLENLYIFYCIHLLKNSYLLFYKSIYSY